MKTNQIFACAALSLLIMFSSCSVDDAIAPDGAAYENESKLLGPRFELDEIESRDLVYLLELQKFHQDVYNSLHSEMKEVVLQDNAMEDKSYYDRIFVLVDKYNLDNPCVDATEGEFNDPGIQMLWDHLMQMKLDNWKQTQIYAMDMESSIIERLHETLSNLSGHPELTGLYNNLLEESTSQLNRLKETS